MLKVFADTNVILDYFVSRAPFDQEAQLLLFGCAMHDYELWISSSQITDLFYILTHGSSKTSARNTKQTLKTLREHLRVASLTEQDVDHALAMTWDDFEDACVYCAAKRIGAAYLVTRNKKDFIDPAIGIVNPHEFLDVLSTSHGITYHQLDSLTLQ